MSSLVPLVLDTTMTTTTTATAGDVRPQPPSEPAQRERERQREEWIRAVLDRIDPQKRDHRETSFKDDMDALADDYLTFLHENLAESSPTSWMTTRDVVGQLFRDFCRCGTNPSFPPRKLRWLESFLMLRMRQRRWIKSSKRSPTTGMLMVTIVQPDRTTFPSPQEQRTERQRLKEEYQILQQDKHDVELKVSVLRSDDGTDALSSNTAANTTVQAAIGQELWITLELSSKRSLQLDDVELNGPHTHLLEPWDQATRDLLKETLPMEVIVPVDCPHATFTWKYKLRPLSHIGLARIRMQVTLEHESVGSFVICRPLTISYGQNSALQAVLQVQEPYQPKSAKKGRKFQSFADLEQSNTTLRGEGRNDNHGNHSRKGKGKTEVHWPDAPKKAKKGGKASRRGGKKSSGTADNNSRNMKSTEFRALGQYRIPKKTMQWVQNQELDAVLDGYDWSPKTTETSQKSAIVDKDDDEVVAAPETVDLATKTEQYKTNLDEYGPFWSQLLYASECQSLLDIQLFDMEQVPLQKQFNGRGQNSKVLFALKVPGLAEGRPSVLRGDFVNLTWKNHLYKGRVHATQLLQVLLEMPQKFVKTFDPALHRVDLVRFTFSRTTFRTSHRACLQYAQEHLGRSVLEPTPDLVPVWRRERNNSCVGKTHQVSSPKFANRNLNAEQEQAIYQIVHGGGGSRFPYIIYGPPGTGKTTCVVEAVYQLARSSLSSSSQGPRILLTAPSNDAADILVQRLAMYFPPKELLRVLAYSRDVNDLPPDIRTYATTTGPSNDADDGNVDPEARQLEAILKARIVVSTVNLAARLIYMGVPRHHFQVICADEAGHATEPELVAVASSLLSVSAISSGTDGKLILAGDPKQLGPITTSRICESYGLGVSLLERLSQRQIYQRDAETKSYPDDLMTKLVQNYRSHPSILKLPNDMFYDGDLRCCGDIMTTHSMVKWEHLPKPGFPIVFHSMKGENLREGNSPSWFNPEEAQQVVAYVDLLIKQTKPALKDDEIGIITPYARQAQKIRAALDVVYPRHNIKVGSVECFQGQERRVIILSTVRSEPELYLDHDIRYNLGFVAHPKRFNVAVTRAKALLIVVGCPSVLSLDTKNWLPFLKYCHENGAWIGEAWDPSVEQDEEEGGDEILPQADVFVGDPTFVAGGGLSASWELVQSEERYAYVNREE